MLSVTNSGLDEQGDEMVIKGHLNATAIDLEGRDLLVEPFIVLDTDYTSFASVYTCHLYLVFGGVVHRQFGWVLLRDNVKLNEEMTSRALDAFSHQNLDSLRLLWSDNSNC